MLELVPLHSHTSSFAIHRDSLADSIGKFTKSVVCFEVAAGVPVAPTLLKVICLRLLWLALWLHYSDPKISTLHDFSMCFSPTICRLQQPLRLNQATDMITCSPAKASTRLGAARLGPSPCPRRLLKLLPWWKMDGFGVKPAGFSGDAKRNPSSDTVETAHGYCQWCVFQ